LGHFKEKFGVRRERVPFVLTHDFVFVINKGVTDREAKEFKFFKDMCEKVRKRTIQSIYLMLIIANISMLQ